MGQSNVVENASRGGGVDPEQVRGAVEAEITRLASRLAVGDGALGFWPALDEIYPQTRQQRCWMHETVNVLNKLSKGAQPKAMQVLHEMWQAKTREDAHGAFTLFLDMYEDTSTRKRPSVWSKITRSYWHSMTFRSRTGGAC